MSVTIAEYLGQRTDVDDPVILPTSLDGKNVPTCPFMGGPCSKLSSSKPSPPVCAVRANGKIFPVCPHRLVPSRASVLTPIHLSMLQSVAKKLIPGVPASQIGYRRQIGVRLPSTSGSSRQIFLDYVLATDPSQCDNAELILLEVQGGGETSSTGSITRHVSEWAVSPEPTNAVLREPLRAGIIPNNAWKRQLEQIIRKAPLAKAFGGRFALAVGEVLYDYIVRSMPGGIEYFSDWEIGVVEMVEAGAVQPGSTLFSANRAMFLTYESFLRAISEATMIDQMPNPFAGEFTTLHNSTFLI